MKNTLKLIMFDLDGTILSMDQDEFIKTYFKELVKSVAHLGYEPNFIIDSVWSGCRAINSNNGTRLNKDVFWDKMKQIFGDRTEEISKAFDNYYKTTFDSVRRVSVKDEKAIELVKRLKSQGYKIALATSPLFPSIATEQRIGWAGLTPNDFDLYTTYENSTYSKPNLDYYKEIMDSFNVSPDECIMVGNDVDEDMVVAELGVKVFLLTDHLLNRHDKDISKYPRGSFKDLEEYFDSL